MQKNIYEKVMQGSARGEIALDMPRVHQNLGRRISDWTV